MSILIDENTTFIIEGITGREAVNMARECLDYGSKLIGGVTPGRGGRDVHGVPVYDTVKEATARGRVDASVISVPPAFVRDAAFEAIEKLIEYARRHDARVIGPNCLGVLSPGKSRVGGMGGAAVAARRAYQPG